MCLGENVFKILYSLVTIIIFYIVSKMCLNLFAYTYNSQFPFRLSIIGRILVVFMLADFYRYAVHE